MTSKEIVLDALTRTGRLAAQEVQSNAAKMSGTELYEQESYIPDFSAAVTVQNMLTRPAGFVCRSSSGRVARLVQPYDSTIYTQEPEELTAQWGFAWSTDPVKALPFVSIATSPYNVGDCCTHNGHTWRSGQAGNVWEPGTPNIQWEDLGPVDKVDSEEILISRKL